MRQRVLVGLLAVLLCAATARAAPITYYFTGIVQDATPITGILEGTPFSGTLVYDPDALLTYTGSNSALFTAAFARASVEVGGSIYQSLGGGYSAVDATSLSGSLFPPGTYDRLSMQLPLVPPYGPFLSYNAYIGLMFADASLEVFDAPPTALPLSLIGIFDYIELQVVGYNESYGDRRSVAGLVTLTQEPQPVPEPSSMFLLGMGLVGLLAARGRRRE